ncbi:isoprenylcysteine carboxylmethyltransferase family protein [Massilia sp. CF038]|uniref:methyltransferase family protein n=1 Tax=Massilia sp. CF038 TaxID=1881045 RepID=UPI000913CDE0|nr:methyltransferase [Massilia sp. CF038]SHG50558.1 Protein-S-isoprenylcysteine O-methyltransferase Ste14 [Massilia sp. CF038]
MNIAALFASRLSQILIGAIMAVVWLTFALLNVRAFQVTGDAVYLVFCGTESVTALFFLVRTKPVTVTVHGGDWALAVAGTFASFLFTPAEQGLLPAAAALIYLGAALQLGGMLSLNRSIGMVPAKRVIKTQGLYRLVRHPLYASYLLSFCGYMLTNTSPANVAVFGITVALLALRILREERHLAQDGHYRDYMAQVKFRLLPFVF